MADKRLKIGTTDEDGNVYVDLQSPFVQRYMGQANNQGQAQNAFLNAVGPAFQVFTGFINQDTANKLRRDLRDQKAAIAVARSGYVAAVKAAVTLQDLQQVLLAQDSINGDVQDAMSDEIDLARLQASQSLDALISGAIPLAQQLLGNGGSGAEGGLDLNSLVVPGLAAFAGYEAGKNNRGGRGGGTAGIPQV